MSNITKPQYSVLNDVVYGKILSEIAYFCMRKMKKKVTKNKGLSDSELLEKYGNKKIDLAAAVKKVARTSSHKKVK